MEHNRLQLISVSYANEPRRQPCTSAVVMQQLQLQFCRASRRSAGRTFNLIQEMSKKKQALVVSKLQKSDRCLRMTGDKKADDGGQKSWKSEVEERRVVLLTSVDFRFCLLKKVPSMAVENLKILLLLGGLFQQMQPKVPIYIMVLLQSCNPDSPSHPSESSSPTHISAPGSTTAFPADFRPRGAIMRCRGEK